MAFSEVEATLNTRGWWNATDPKVQGVVRDLFDRGREGFVRDLAQNPDRLGDLNITKLVMVVFEPFSACLPVFEVNKDGQKPYTMSYHSWKTGPASGAKGVVFVRNTDGEVTHFVTLKAMKFAVHGETFDAIGGFTESGEFNVSETILREITEEIGKVGEVEVVNLGSVYTDAGMTNNHPGMFAAFITVTPDVNHSNTDKRETSQTIQVRPITEFAAFLSDECDDSFTLAAATRLIVKGLLPNVIDVKA